MVPFVLKLSEQVLDESIKFNTLCFKGLVY